MVGRGVFSRILVVMLGLVLGVFILTGCAQSDSNEMGSSFNETQNSDQFDAGEESAVVGSDIDSDARSNADSGADEDSSAHTEAGAGAADDKNNCDIVLNTNAADEIDDSYDGQLEDIKDAGEEPENGEGL